LVGVARLPRFFLAGLAASVLETEFTSCLPAWPHAASATASVRPRAPRNNETGLRRETEGVMRGKSSFKSDITAEPEQVRQARAQQAPQ
jgi:hypothetical protein